MADEDVAGTFDFVVGAEREVVILLLRRRIDPAPLITRERPLLVVLITINGGVYTSLDGQISASGQHGGSITASSQGDMGLNGQLAATGTTGNGGSVGLFVAGNSWETTGASVDVSGANGGTIRNLISGGMVSSARYSAKGTSGQGGAIDITGRTMLLLSSSFDASGHTGGGQVRIGGEYQGGKNLSTDELANATRLTANDGVSIDVSATGNNGDAGTAILWSDDKTTFLGRVYATGGLLTGRGGLVEASSANELIWRGTVETARNGLRGGTLLLDPKNITIANASLNTLALILRDAALEANDNFGSAVSMQGNQLVVGAALDDGATNANADAGAVYLFTFTDAAFNGGALTGRIGIGYSGAGDGFTRPGGQQEVTTHARPQVMEKTSTA